MNILVTGGTGLLGSRLIPVLAAEHKVYALVRSELAREKVLESGALPVEGDLESSVPLVLPQLDAIIHAAAVFRFSGPSAPFFRTNVEGTERLLAEAERVGVRHFIHISAAGIIMDESGSPLRRADETAPIYTKHFSAYLASKAQAEQRVRAANKPGFRTIALRPPVLWGPGDPFSREIPRALLSGLLMFIDHGNYPFSTCHVDNLVEAIQCALKEGGGGRAFFITDSHTQTFRDFVGSIAAVQGLSVEKVRSMPYWLASATGRLMETIWTILQRKDDPPLSRSMVCMIGREFSVSDIAARKELGYTGKTSLAEGLLSYGNVLPPY
jgi:nucleoside-diphosphate-sugar epimerase